jgi:hypothetical protein
MLLLTWHGTILRVEQTNRRLTHAAPVPKRDVGFDFAIELPPQHATAVPVAGGMEALPGTRPGTLHLRRGNAFLSVAAEAAFPLCDGAEPGDWETLLSLAEDEADALRHILGASWRREDTGDELAAARLTEGFTLALGELLIDLASHRPALLPDGGVVLRMPAGDIRLARQDAPVDAEWHLRPAAPEHRARDVATTEALHNTPNSRLTVPSPEERVHLPLTARLSDRDWLYQNPWMGAVPLSGRQLFQSQVVHETDKFVLLERQVEGIVFGEHGVTNTHGYLGNLTGAMPPDLAREADQFFVSAAALRAAPRLHGPHAVFYGGNLTNYFHWIIDAMLPLSLLQPHLPPGTTLLLPGTLAQFRANPNGRFDHLETLDAFGFGAMPRVEVASRLCHVEDVYWADRCFIEQVSAAELRTARDRALTRLAPPAGAARRIFIRRTTTRRIANADEIEAFAAQQGFEVHTMEDMSVTEQIELFRHASFVIGAHGAALANLVFCPPGAKVIELAPDSGYRPFFALIASKLGLTHGILPCTIPGGNFFGDLRVHKDRLAALLRLLGRRL